MKFKWKKPRNYKLNKKTAKKVEEQNTVPSVATVRHIVNRALGNVIETKHADCLFEPNAASALFHNVWYLMETDSLKKHGTAFPSKRVACIALCHSLIVACYHIQRIISAPNFAGSSIRYVASPQRLDLRTMTCFAQHSSISSGHF
jgi:hypothetical protein